MKDSLESTFENLARDNKSTIFSVCYMYAKDHDEAADLFQECLINIWKGLPSFNGDCAPATWIYRVCLNTCITADRKKKARGQHVRLDINYDAAAEQHQDNTQIRMLHDRIGALGPIDRALVLLWLEDLSYQEIGQIIGISAQNVGVRLYRIKEQLKSSPK